MAKKRKKKSKSKGGGGGGNKKKPETPAKSAATSAPTDSPNEDLASEKTLDTSADTSSDEELGGGATMSGERPDGPAWEWSQRDGEPNAVFHIRRLNNAIGVLEAVVIAALLATLIGVASYQALAGRIFNAPFEHGGEIIIYSVFWIAVVGAALAAQRNRLISMDLVSRLLPKKVRAGLRIVLAVFSIFICILVIKAGLLDLAVSRKLDGEFIGRVVGVAPFPVGIGLVALHIALHAAMDAIYLASGKTPYELGAPVH